MSTTTDTSTRPPITDRVLVRLDSQRQQTLHAGIAGSIKVLTDPSASEAQRTAWGESYMQCVLAQLAEIDARIDDRVWSLLTRAVAA
jgi:predicted ATPase